MLTFEKLQFKILPIFKATFLVYPFAINPCLLLHKYFA